MMLSTAGLTILLLVTTQRLGELVLNRHNTKALMAMGGVEHGAKHYPLFILLHGGWLISLFIWMALRPSSIQWGWVLVYLIIQAGRFWVIRTLASNWTTRIISVPERPLVNTGPYRFMRHPNYCVVAAEIAILPLAFGSWQIAVVFSLLNGLLLTHRIKIENAVLDERR